MNLSKRTQPRGTGFFAHLNQQFGVEAETSPTRCPHRVKSSQVDAMLPFIVGDASPIPAIAFYGQGPGIKTIALRAFLASYHIAMAVD